MGWKRTALSMVLVGGCIWCCGLVQRVYSEEQKADAGDCYKPVAPPHDLMEAQDQHFEEIKDLLGQQGARRFRKLSIHANILAELCNVNQYQSEEKDYKNWAIEARDLSLKLAKAGKDKDQDAASELVREIHARCTSCHDKYN